MAIPDPNDLEILDKIDPPDNSTYLKSPSTALRESRVLREYLSNGYNGSKAIEAVYDVANSKTASAMASEILHRPSLQGKIHAILQEQGAGIAEQIRVLGQIAKGHYIRTIETTITDAKGNVSTKVVREQAGPRDIATAINLLAKLTGTYDSMRVKATIATQEAKRLYATIDRDIAKARRVATDAIAGDAMQEAEGDGSGGNGLTCTYEQVPSATRKKKSNQSGISDCDQLGISKGAEDVEELQDSGSDGQASASEEGSVVEEASVQVGEAE